MKPVLDMVIFICCIVIFLFSTGCITDDNSAGNGALNNYDFYVNGQYNAQTNGWNIDHFKNISDAIGHSKDNTSIFVYNGTYHENLEINKKNLHLSGENANTTIIYGMGEEDVISILKDGQKISGFTITNSSLNYNSDTHAGVDIRSDNNIITHNIFKNNSCGIYIRYGDENNIFNNIFKENIACGTYIESKADENKIYNNIYINNSYSLRIRGSDFCTISNNAFISNEYGLYLCCGTKYSLSYGNIFCNNTEWDAADQYENHWDSDLSLKWGYNETYMFATNGKIGNFWNKYHTIVHGAYDNDTDGIIDSVFDIPEVDTDDRYPLSTLPTINNPFFTDQQIESYVNSQKQ